MLKVIAGVVKTDPVTSNIISVHLTPDSPSRALAEPTATIG